VRNAVTWTTQVEIEAVYTSFWMHLIGIANMIYQLIECGYGLDKIQNGTAIA
jgi:hypothetical protein